MKTIIVLLFIAMSCYAEQVRALVVVQDANVLRSMGVPVAPTDHNVAIDVFVGTDQTDVNGFFVAVEYTLLDKQQTQRVLVRAATGSQLTPTVVSFRVGILKPTIDRVIIEPATDGQVLARYEFSGQQISATRGLLIVE